ncbi:MAG TPA: DUF1801 domain-containing protein [Candidatus Acidoferrales bacterium]|nr:DUF1801 domain-containing protein [Candidatus Acidoferrales bacterium]
MPAKQKSSASSGSAKTPSPYKFGPGKEAEKWIDDYVAQSAAELRPLADFIRRLVRRAVPKSQEAVNPWRIPTFDFHGPLCFMMIGKRHITFGFPRGSWLKDSAGLLEGTGKNLRHVKVKAAADINERGLRELVQESAGLNRESPLGASMRPKKN